MKVDVAWTSHPSFHATVPNSDALRSCVRNSMRARLHPTFPKRKLLHAHHHHVDHHNSSTHASSSSNATESFFSHGRRNSLVRIRRRLSRLLLPRAARLCLRTLPSVSLHARSTSQVRSRCDTRRSHASGGDPSRTFRCIEHSTRRRGFASTKHGRRRGVLGWLATSQETRTCDGARAGATRRVPDARLEARRPTGRRCESRRCEGGRSSWENVQLGRKGLGTDWDRPKTCWAPN